MQINELFSGEIKVVNMGLTAFNDAIAKQGLKGCQVDWKPPADPQVYALLDALDDEKVDAANREAVRRINAAAFVNGILDAAAKAAENGTLLPGPDAGNT